MNICSKWFIKSSVIASLSLISLASLQMLGLEKIEASQGGSKVESLEEVTKNFNDADLVPKIKQINKFIINMNKNDKIIEINEMIKNNINKNDEETRKTIKEGFGEVIKKEFSDMGFEFVEDSTIRNWDRSKDLRYLYNFKHVDTKVRFDVDAQSGAWGKLKIEKAPHSAEGQQRWYRFEEVSSAYYDGRNRDDRADSNGVEWSYYDNQRDLDKVGPKIVEEASTKGVAIISPWNHYKGGNMNLENSTYTVSKQH